jgi:S1-C subfamily serine protease
VIDIVLVLILLGYAISGFRQGLVVGVLSLGGFVGGAVLAMWLAPEFLGGIEAGPRRSLFVLLAVVVTAWIGQFLGAILGGRVRSLVPGGPIATADHAAGAVAGVVAVGLVLWFVAGAVRGGPSPAVSRAVASSRVIQTIDRLVPPGLVGVADAFRTAVGDSGFPRVFAGIGPERITPVEPPDRRVLSAAALEKARAGVVKITGQAVCGRGQEGSGAVIGKQRVITNAHVVAGVTEPSIQLFGSQRKYPATVVAFDPRRDVAILAVPALSGRVLPLGQDLARSDSALVAGYPNDGPFRTEPARVRTVELAIGEDIYGQKGAEREVYSLYVTVQPGNSGGPVLNPQGEVAGVVFAKSLDDAKTGYALTLNEVRPVINAGLTATAPVNTGSCAVG